MKLPEINETVTSEQALDLCRHFDLAYLASRIEANPGGFKEWVFDGCSCLPDEALGLFTGCEWQDITYRCCLPHDLCYAYGEPGNVAERKRVDAKFDGSVKSPKSALRESVSFRRTAKYASFFRIRKP